MFLKFIARLLFQWSIRGHVLVKPHVGSIDLLMLHESVDQAWQKPVMLNRSFLRIALRPHSPFEIDYPLRLTTGKLPTASVIRQHFQGPSTQLLKPETTE